ncbi:FkbM family methyltransferase [Nitrobacter hamburgensis]|nr:FkbM family methyltransferase [Nitrobacter hamburgensis]
MLKYIAKRALRPITRRLAFRTEAKVQQGIKLLSEEMNRRFAEIQRQNDRLRIELYFSQLSSGRTFSPTKAVELKVPNSSIEMVLCGPAEDRSIIGAIEYQQGYYEPHVIAALSRLIPETASCIDIGANIGAISLQLSKVAARGHVYSFEPASASFGYLTHNITANGINNITAYNLGASDKSQDLVLNYISDLSGCSFVLGTTNALPEELSTAKQETIHCIAIDDWVRRHNIPPIDFIKLDAEGMEQSALRGASDLLMRDKPDLAIEFNPHTSDDFGHGTSEELFETLNRYWDQIYLTPRDVSELPILIRDYNHLMEMVKLGPGWEDLFCTTDDRQRARCNVSAH